MPLPRPSSWSHRRRLTVGTAGLALAGAAAWLALAGLDWQAIPRALGRLPSAAILGVTAVLPLAGFPISMVYLVIGARYGPGLGLAVVAGITAAHLLGTHGIARGFLREPLRRSLERRGHRVPAVPPGENAAVALMVMLAPAVPYFMRNYVLALSGIPLRVYFWVALPVHVLRSYVALFLGDFTGDPSSRGLVLIGLIYGAKLAVFAAIAWRLRRRHKRAAA